MNGKLRSKKWGGPNKKSFSILIENERELALADSSIFIIAVISVWE
jgi:hypothetical protein